MVGGGVAIFHLASKRVVLCSQADRSGRKVYFLPKGRRDAGEESSVGAEREGYEEVCYLTPSEEVNSHCALKLGLSGVNIRPCSLAIEIVSSHCQ